MFVAYMVRVTIISLLFCVITSGSPVSSAVLQKGAADEITQRLQLAQKLQQQGEVIRATSELRQALGLALEQLGGVYDALGVLEKAALAYSAAVEAKADSDKSLLGLAIV